jgi:hypothetical protein
MDVTIATMVVVGGFAIFALYYGFFVARRGKRKGDTARSWCMPQGHSDVDERTSDGREMAPPDECPTPADQPRRGENDQRSGTFA